MQARNFPMKLPLPDLSRWPADKELLSGEPEAERTIQLPEIWVPEIPENVEEMQERPERKVREVLEPLEPAEDIMGQI